MTKEITKAYTEKQTKFLEELSNPVHGGDLRKAMRAAGYSDGTNLEYVIKPLKDEIIAIGEALLAGNIVKGVSAIIDAIDNPARPATNNKIAAAKELLDRAGLRAKDKDAINAGKVTNVMFILPAKDKPIKTIEGNINTIVDNVEELVENLNHDQESVDG